MILRGDDRDASDAPASEVQLYSTPNVFARVCRDTVYCYVCTLVVGKLERESHFVLAVFLLVKTILDERSDWLKNLRRYVSSCGQAHFFQGWQSTIVVILEKKNLEISVRSVAHQRTVHLHRLRSPLFDLANRV